MELIKYRRRIDFTTIREYEYIYTIEQCNNFILDYSFKLAQVMELTGKWDNAIKHLSKAIKISKTIPNRRKEANLKALIGKILLSQGNHAKTSLMIEEMRRIGEELKDKSIIAEAYRLQALLYINIGDFNKSIEANKNSLAINREIGNEKSIALNLAGLGNIYIYLRKHDKAIHYYKKSMRVFQRKSDQRNIATITGNIGVMYNNKGEFDTALEYYTTSLNLFRELGDKSGIARQLLNVGVIYNLYKHEPDKAFSYYQQSLNIYRELNEKAGIARLLGNIGGIYSENFGQYDKALQYYTESLDIRKKLGDKRGIARTMLYIGIVFYNSGEYEKAVEYHNLSLQGMKDISLNADLGYNHSYLSLSLIKLNRTSEAIQTIKNHLDNVDKMRVKVYVIRTYLSIAIIMGNIATRKEVTLDEHIREDFDAILERLGWEKDINVVFPEVVEMCRDDKTDPTLIITALIEYASFLRKNGEKDKVSFYIDEAKDKARAMSLFIKELNTYES
jgi:tetratricopeptide (TPR) repeat protein